MSVYCYTISIGRQMALVIEILDILQLSGMLIVSCLPI